ncbi:Pantothenate synthetase [Galdieria sulphuraria]|nr:Pantothenate synthetase [Galdieria sulphuraria]
MQLIKDLNTFSAIRSGLEGEIGLVPTMGFLHEGHKALIRRARMECSILFVTIFVNPTQFAPGEDLDTYPRNLPGDLRICEELEVDFVFAPDSFSILYPEGFCTFVECKIGLPGTNPKSEGAFRPHFFRGVATVVAKLFNIVKPSKAYFGQKDAQQCSVVQRMVVDLNLNVEIIIVPTVREADGLAMSSRNAYLTKEERERATILYQMLQRAKELYLKGITVIDRIREEMESLARQVDGFHLHYVSICDPKTFIEYENEIPPSDTLVCVAGTLGKARLIDNIRLN